jgi:RNA polymerase sigma-70 factor (ECF subfamily)
VNEVGSQGWEALYRHHRSELLRFLIARTGDASEAEEVLQEMWVKLHRAPITHVTSARAYLYRMAQNLVVDRLRERQRRMRRERLWLEQDRDVSAGHEDQADPTRSAEDALLDREETARLMSAIATLPEGARRAFDLHKLQGLSHAEVAARLGISKSGVEKHIAVAMKYLRRAMLD